MKGKEELFKEEWWLTKIGKDNFPFFGKKMLLLPHRLWAQKKDAGYTRVRMQKTKDILAKKEITPEMIT